MANIVVVSGQFGNGRTSFSGSPVVVKVSGLAWPMTKLSPFTVVRIEVKDSSGSVVGKFHVDTAQQTEITFDISSALRVIWAGYDFSNEVAAAAACGSASRSYIEYSLELYTEYLNTDGYYEGTESGSLSGGSCAIGWLTEWERSIISSGDMSVLEGSNTRNGDASTKPTSSPELVGKSSITSWVDLKQQGTYSRFYAASTLPVLDTTDEHPPIVVRDSVDYTDFLFVNRRGAVETCSALMKEEMSIEVKTKSYYRVERPTFSPSRSLMTITQRGPRRSWSMSSGNQTRDWAEWWSTEFLTARRHWMRYKGPGLQAATFVPVTVEPAKSSTGIYNRAKQNMPHVDFTVTLALEG